jgi:glycine cleavage system H protein
MSETNTTAERPVPKDGEFDRGRFWFSRRGNVLTVGLTNHGMETLGELEEITLPDEGEHLGAEDEIIQVDGTRASIDLVLPTKGLVLEVNPAASDLETVTEDPLEAGWLVRYQIEDLQAILDA